MMGVIVRNQRFHRFPHFGCTERQNSILWENGPEPVSLLGDSNISSGYTPHRFGNKATFKAQLFHGSSVFTRLTWSGHSCKGGPYVFENPASCSDTESTGSATQGHGSDDQSAIFNDRFQSWKVGTHRTRALTRGSHAVGAAMRYLPLRLFPWQQPLSWLCTARNVHKTRPPAGARRKRRVRRSESGWKRAWAGRPTLQTPAVSRLLPRASATASESLTRRARRLGRARRGLLTGRFGSREARETASWPTVKTRIAFSSPPRAARARAVAGETRIRRDSRLGREETLCPVPPPPAPALRGSESV